MPWMPWIAWIKFLSWRTCILLWILYGNMVDFSFIVSLYVSDLLNVTTSTSTHHKFFCIGFCLAFSVCQSPFRGLPQDMAVPSRCLRRDFPKKVKSIFSYGIARPLENKLRMNFDA